MSLSGLRKVAAFRFNPNVVQLAAVVHIGVVIIAWASDENHPTPKDKAMTATLNKIDIRLDIVFS